MKCEVSNDRFERYYRIPACMIPSVRSFQADLIELEKRSREGKMEAHELRQLENRAIGLVLRITTENLANSSSSRGQNIDSGIGSYVEIGSSLQPSQKTTRKEGSLQVFASDESSSHTASMKIGSEIHQITFLSIKNKYWLPEKHIYQL